MSYIDTQPYKKLLKTTGNLVSDATFTGNNWLKMHLNCSFYNNHPAVIAFTVRVNCTVYHLFFYCHHSALNIM